MKNYIRWFDQVRSRDQELVGGKNASLGIMIQELSQDDIPIPNGFAVTADAYWAFIEHNKILPVMKKQIRSIKDYQNITQVQNAGRAIRMLFLNGRMPEEIAEQIREAYQDLSQEYNVKQCDVAVRSSATAEDLPTASFAGQQETFLNIKGGRALIEACIKSMASLFTDRAIVYRKTHKFDHFKVALSVGVQKMVRAGKGSAGVMFSLDTESGYKDVVMIDSTWGLGESIVKGLVTPDEFYVFKPTLEKGFEPIIKKRLGEKKVKMIYASGKHPTRKVKVPLKDQQRLSLSDKEVLELARMADTIDRFYSKKNRRWTPMDIEWAQDGRDGTLYIVQARPETVHSQKEKNTFKVYTLLSSQTLREPQGERRKREKVNSSVRPEVLEGSRRKREPIISGIAIGQQIVSGIARVVKDSSQITKIKKDEIIVTTMTDPDWVPVMKKAAGIITDLGGRTCHAAIVSRELGTPAVVGTEQATKKVRTGQKITIDCSRGTQGAIYAGLIPFEAQDVTLKKLPKIKTKLMVNIANPDTAFSAGMLPVDGVGLARMEFIIANQIQVHPMALLEGAKVKDKKIKEKINALAKQYPSKKQFFIDTLAQGIGMIAAGFYPRPVIVRLSDFKTNEYRDLLGGEYFEPEESNPMLGFRGASRYTHALYDKAFALECAALKKAREQFGLDNIQIMVPFVRTPDEAKRVLTLLKKHGLQKAEPTFMHQLLGHSSGLQYVMMVEVPSNIVLIDQFAKLFDSFSIGSNDLTQFVLGVDRDSALLRDTFDERDPAVQATIADAIKGAHRAKRPIGICGQGPSDYPEFAQFLIDHKIDSISLNTDAVLSFLMSRL